MDFFVVLAVVVFYNHCLLGLQCGEGCHRAVVDDSVVVFHLLDNATVGVFVIVEQDVRLAQFVVIVAEFQLGGLYGEIFFQPLQKRQGFFVSFVVFEIFKIRIANSHGVGIVVLLYKIIEAAFQIRQATVGVLVVFGVVGELNIDVGEVAVCQMFCGYVYGLIGIDVLKYFDCFFEVMHCFLQIFDGDCLDATQLAEPVITACVFERIVDERIKLYRLAEIFFALGIKLPVHIKLRQVDIALSDVGGVVVLDTEFHRLIDIILGAVGLDELVVKF